MPSFPPRRSDTLAYGHGVEYTKETRFIKPPRRRKGGDGRSLAAFFNKRLGIFCCWVPLLLLAGRGGEGENKGDMRLKVLSSYPGSCGCTVGMEELAVPRSSMVEFFNVELQPPLEE